MEFRILGPLEVLEGTQQVALGGRKRRAVLALLLLHPDEIVGSERMVDELWGETAPAGALKTLQVHISRLRKELPDVLVTRGHGYELQLEPDQLDARRFERVVDEARAELAGERPERALALLESGLALWRGPPLADLAYEPFAQAEIARLEDLRVAAEEQLIDAKLALGRHAEVIGQLERLVETHPYRERLRGQLMLALYRADRQADALQAYQDARGALVEELGIEPGERLRELEGAVLAQDPSLALVLPEAPAAPANEPVTAGLPSGVVTFLLTDIEGSSGLWEADHDAMAASLELHDAIVAAGVEAGGGRVLKTKGEGDSTVSVFPRASDALACAAALRASLAAAPWYGELDLRVRIAIHTGEAHERDGDYFGPALNRAARLRGLASGGATLLSQATTEMVHDRVPAGMELVDLGTHDLRGLSRPERVYELRTEGAESETELLPVQEVRKTVTVLFAALGDAGVGEEGIDAEARRRVSSHSLANVQTVLERHGATVQDCPGDVLMAVFGVPLLHDDDAHRAVRAAVEVRQMGLNTQIGIATGEVISDPASAGHRLATGAPVNLAKRLTEVARLDDILVDDATHGLLRDSVSAQTATVEGTTAFRVAALHPGRKRARGLESPLVGRGQQLGALSSTFAAAVADRSCHLVTVLGAAGVGKSRLVEDFTHGIEDGAAVLRCRCLPYGEGITYWPLAELVRDVAGTAGADPSADIRSAVIAELGDEPKADLIADVLAEAIGVGGSGASPTEKIPWAARRLFEVLARRRPLVIVLDDLQWAEPTFLDLVEHVADLARDAPMVLLCMARPELLDSRAGWGGGKLNAASIHLEPLSADESKELVENLVAALVPDAAERIAKACEGHPLFAEELLAMLIDEGLLRRSEGRWSLTSEAGTLPVPPTIQALLAARLERLPEEERALLARVSIEGTVFHREAMAALAPAALAPIVDRALNALVRRDVIRPDRSSVGDEDAFRFRHILIRDAAYRSLPKETRAELHERFADWLEDVAASRMDEFEEIVGYHLEQACRFHAELGREHGDTTQLVSRGADRLEAAGRRALRRGDRAAAVTLLQRAAALVSSDATRCATLLPDLAGVLIEAGRLADADAVLADARAAAEAAGDEPAAARALVQDQFLRIQLGESAGTAEASAVVERVLPVFRAAGAEGGMCSALRLRAWNYWIAAQAEAATAAWEEAVGYARIAGLEHERIEILGWIASAHFFGPTPVAVAIERCEDIRAEVQDNLVAVADVLQSLAGLHAMEGRFDDARALLAKSESTFEELGLALFTAVSHNAASLELLAGDPVAAERCLRKGYAALEEMGDRALLSTTAAFLGQALLAQGRDEEAERYALVSAELASDDDLITQVLWRGVRARAVAHANVDEAESLAREAVALAAKTDFVNHQAEARVDLGMVLVQRGQANAAQDAFKEAVDLYELKGNAVAAARVRADLVAPTRV
jgi:predicted ATPase/class 3 adenylate cyclase